MQRSDHYGILRSHASRVLHFKGSQFRAQGQTKLVLSLLSEIQYLQGQDRDTQQQLEIKFVRAGNSRKHLVKLISIEVLGSQSLKKKHIWQHDFLGTIFWID